MSARYIVGDVFDVLATLEPDSVDLVFSSPPFLALRSYLPADHPDKGKEIGSEATPADFLDTLLDVVEACDRVLTPHGSLCFDLGDTFSGSGGAGGDYANAGLRDGQPTFDGSASRERRLVRAEEYDGGASDHHDFAKPGTRSRAASGDGWPDAKSLCLIPTLFAASLAYGYNMLRPERTTPRWRVRNLVVWARPNPPVGALGDKFRPATSYLTVACKSAKRYFDLDAVRTEHTMPDSRGAVPYPRQMKGRVGTDGENNPTSSGNNPAGAPPLDYWVIPTHPSNDEETGRRLRVPLDALVGGIQRTTSPSCPVHGSQDLPGSSAPDGERGAGESIRTARTGGRRGRAQTPETQPTSQTLDLLGSTDSQDDQPATARSTASSRTAPAPATTTPGTPSAQTVADTERMSASPESSAPGANKPESSTGQVGSPAHSPSETTDRTVGTDALPELSACSCPQFVEIALPEDSRDYAAIPPGRETGGKYGGRSNASREPLSGDRGGSAFQTHEMGAPPLDYWVIPTHGFPGAHYATFPPDLVVKPVASMCPQRVCRVCGEPSRRIVQVDGLSGADFLGEGNDRAIGLQGPRPSMPEITRETLGWTDCGHDDWRAGVVLDPFAGSGTTLAVATGHGRDAIGIDLDGRNADLALDRVGPMFLTVEHLTSEGAA